MRTLHQAPRPAVKIYSPDDGPEGESKMEFGPGRRTVLQSYAFSSSVNDAKGVFTLTFYPAEDKPLYRDDPIFDRIEEWTSWKSMNPKRTLRR